MVLFLFEKSKSARIFDQIRDEAHFDPRTRHDFALGSPRSACWADSKQ
jgi:hypothetical protein